MHTYKIKKIKSDYFKRGCGLTELRAFPLCYASVYVQYNIAHV